MKETEVNTNFAQIVNYHILSFLMNYFLPIAFQIKKFLFGIVINNLVVKLILQRKFIVRKFSCFFQDIVISYYLLNSHAYDKKYREDHSQEKRQIAQKLVTFHLHYFLYPFRSLLFSIVQYAQPIKSTIVLLLIKNIFRFNTFRYKTTARTTFQI